MNYVYYGYELYHHGIRGQRWGERNGPPYPLSGGKDTVDILNDAFQQNLDWESWEPGTDFFDSSNGLKYKKKSNESTEAFKQRRLTELSNEIAMKSGKSTRGTILYMSSWYAMGHIFNYAVDSKGNVTFLDGQINDSNAVSNINDLDSSFKFSFARLDNLDLSNGVTDYVRKH